MHEPRWRTATIVVTVIAALEFVALAGAGVALIGNPLAKHYKVEAAAAAAASHARSTPLAPASKARLTRGETSVMVLNGNGRAGAAAAAAQRVRAHGYLLGQVGNARSDTYRRSVVMYRPGYAAEGTRLAHDLHVRIVSPLDGMRASQLQGSHLVLVVGA
jgi:LytR cell envelope-related transcriptional attenuator